MSDEELLRIARACRAAWLAEERWDEGVWDRVVLAALREAYVAGALAARPRPPGDAPVPEGRLDEIRAAVADVWSALGTDPAVERDGRDLLAALDHQRKRADHCESAMADLLAESDRLRKMIESLAARVAAQSALLTARAERGPEARG